MNILSIETSCDETAIAIVNVGSGKNPAGKILAHTVASQIELHTQYGGVFPMMAKREHAKNILPVLLETLKKAGFLAKAKKPAEFPVQKISTILARENDLGERFLNELPIYKKPKIDKIAVTVGPGLTPALWVGISFAKALSLAWDIPIVPVNHMEGHLLSTLITDSKKSFKLSQSSFDLPAISLLVSGGHTELVLFKKIGAYKVVGQTRDDAAGEAFDKVARMLGLAYPGGPLISKLASEFRNKKIESKTALPRPMIHSKDFDFSFSGLKTSVLYLLRDLGEIDENKKMEIACEFENAVVDVLIAKTFAAVKKFKAQSIIIGGGVSANTELQKRFTSEAKKYGIPVYLPTKNLSTDNAIMIAIAGYFAKPVSLISKKLIAVGNLEL
ncbi:MAG: tRNA (adenosine(37)-N6)-threonylcarbamoyltransferase complex transferase subunit TsaD [bacterium]